MNKILLIPFLLVFVYTTAISSEVKFNPVEMHIDSLENGLKIIYHVDKSAPVVATIMHYKVGSRDEDPERTGFAHFFEHLMFEATENIPEKHQDKYIQEAGGNLNAHTSFDETVYKFNVPSHQLPLPLWIESQRMRKLIVARGPVEVQRGVVKEERKNRIDNRPYGDMFELMSNYLFDNGSYSWTPIGSAQHIDKAEISEFREFYNNFYQPNNAVLVISGDFEVAVAKKYVESYFGQIPAAPEPERRVFMIDSLYHSADEIIIDDKAQIPAVFIGYRAPEYGHEDYYAASLLQMILSAGESSRLYKRLVDQEQSAVQAIMQYEPLQKSGMFLFIGVANSGKDIENVRKQIIDELNKLVLNGISDEELKKAKNMYLAQSIYSKKNAYEKAAELAKYMVYFGNPYMINKEINIMQAVTAEDIRKVAAKYLSGVNNVILTYKPEN